MIIVIDGYNVLKHLSKGDRVGPSERAQFVAQLGRYAKKRKHDIQLVFDGGAYGLSSAETDHAIRVIYVGSGETADDYIARLLATYRGKDALLISTDRGLGDRAKRLQIPTLDASLFCDYMAFALNCDGVNGQSIVSDSSDLGVIKTASGNQPALDTLMLESSQIMSMKRDDMAIKNGIGIEGKCDAGLKNRLSSNSVLSKRDRQLLSLLKKL